MLRVLFLHTDDVAAKVRVRPMLEVLLKGLGPRAIYLPNSGRELPSASKPAASPTFFWASSAQPMDAPDLDEACLSINDAVQSLNTEIVMAGRFPQRLLDFFPSRRVLVAQLHQVLRQTVATTEPFSFRAISTPNVARTIERRICSPRSRIFRLRQLVR